MLECTWEMLSRDIPVILSIGPNTPFLWKNEGVTFYNREILSDVDDTSNENSPSDINSSIHLPTLYRYRPVKNNINSHYVTVTGLYKMERSNRADQEESPNGNGKIMLRISSWGKLYYIDYNQYRDYIDNFGGTFTSSMIYIK
jgi:hypothetical protein